jgi:phage terminase large subunit
LDKHKANTFLSKELIDEIEYLQQTDKEFWKIYGLGEYGNIKGLVYENVKPINKIPNDVKLVCYGLDFGFSQDPTACIAVYRKDNKLYLKEIIYSTELTNDDINHLLKENGLDRRDEVICDSAEPKSIQELYNLGTNAKPAKKGKDSISNGINILKRFEIFVDEESTNLLKEFRLYKWATDKNGNSLNRPIDKYNHALDAIRYVALIHLSHGSSGKYFVY